MAPIAIELRQPRPGGAVRRVHEPLGGVFAPVKGASRPVYVYGPATRRARDVLFTCPVSAIPPVVWELLEDWRACRLMHCLPLAGGWRDQPLLVRRAFPIFEEEMRGWERTRDVQTQAEVLAVALKGRAR